MIKQTHEDALLAWATGVGITKQMREDRLRKSASLHRGDPIYHIAQEVMRMTTKRSMRAFVNDLGKDPLCPEERVFLILLLNEIGRGEDVVSALRIEPRRAGHRQRDPLAQPIAEEVRRRIDEGDEPGAARADVAKIVGKDVEAVRAICRRFERAAKR